MTQVEFNIEETFNKIADNINNFLPMFANAIVVALVGFVVIRILSWISSWIIGFIKMPKGLKGIIIALLDTVLAIFLMIVVLKALGLNDLALAFTAGVAAIGIAVGNGSVTLVADIIAGVYLAQDRDFGVGDIVQAGPDGIEGEIISLDLRRTRIADRRGRIHSLPNSVIERNAFVLITKKRNRKLK